MSSQFMQAWAIDAKTLAAAIGGKDRKLVARACKRDLAEEIREIVEEDDDATLEEQLAAIVNGKKIEAAEWHTLRCISLLADVLGSRVGEDLDLPGRGWHELGPAWKHWKLPTVAKLWTTEPAWAKRLGGGWPAVMLAANKVVPKLVDELTAFDPASIVTLGVPKTVDRFGDGGWEMQSLSECVAELVAELTTAAKGAKRKKRDLVIWIDGQQ